MNRWIQYSIDYANQRSYLNDLFQVYPMIPDSIREINEDIWSNVEIAYLKRDKTAIERNPRTINRICVGPMFKEWLRKKTLGILPVDLETFLSNKEDAILDGSDKTMMDFAREEFNYTHNKGLDFVARFNGKYVIGETNFLTDFGGHQNAQFADAISTIETPNVKAEKIAILDGYLCSLSYRKMYEEFSEAYKDYNTMSVLVLRNFLYQL
ncbi:MAG: restriction endonuclease [Dysgonamonadaceae bacterium]|jgi:hypothetical protein|nr:restriction endonuclease [Dysgonamonadaceae bacterium]